MVECVGAILAGGKSSRMSRDKASLCLHGKTLLHHMKHILEEAGIEEIYISHPDSIPDDIPGYGPLSGIHAILNNTSEHHECILFVPIDMPGLTPAIISKLIAAPSDAPLVHFRSYKMPFRLNTDKQWLKFIELLLSKGGDMSLGAFQKNIPNAFAITALSAEQNCFQNINTPKEWGTFVEGWQQ